MEGKYRGERKKYWCKLMLPYYREPRKAREFGRGCRRQFKVHVFPLSPLINWLRWLLPPHMPFILMCFYNLLELCRIISYLWIMQLHVYIYRGRYKYPFCRSVLEIWREGHLHLSRDQKRRGKKDDRRKRCGHHFFLFHLLSMYVCVLHDLEI